MTGSRLFPSRRFQIQAALLGAVLILAVLLIWQVASNIQRQSLHFGLGFLSRTAGFSILQTLIPFNETSTYGRAFVVGLLNTLAVAVCGVVASTFLGFAVGLGRLAPNRLLRWLSTGYVELIRNLPLLLILFFLYFGLLRQLPPPRQSLAFAGIYLNNRGLFLPSADLSLLSLGVLAIAIFGGIGLAVWGGKKRLFAGLACVCALAALWLTAPAVSWPEVKGLGVAGGVKLIPEFVALAAALSIYTASYIAEIVRAGIQAVPLGQRDAAEALGLSPRQTTRLVIIPQAMRLILPPLTSQYLNLTKNSSLAVAIAYPDLVSVFAGTTLAQTGQAVEIIAITMAVYLTLSLGTAALLNWRRTEHFS